MKPNGVKKNTLDCTNKQQDIFQNIFYVPQKKESLTGLGRHDILCAKYPYWSDQATKLMSI